MSNQHEEEYNELTGDTLLIPDYVVIPYLNKHFILSMEFIVYTAFDKKSNCIFNVSNHDLKILESAGLTVCTDQKILDIEFEKIRKIIKLEEELKDKQKYLIILPEYKTKLFDLIEKVKKSENFKKDFEVIELINLLETLKSI